jgi:alkylation response protein AidB-like acyl-CoA dehydrogenase
MDFSLTEEQRAIRDSIYRFAERELAPIAAEIDEKEQFPIKVFHKLGEEGFLGACFPEEYGGAGGSFMDVAIIKEELSRVSAGFSMAAMVSPMFFGYHVMTLGTQEQKRNILPDIISGKKVGCWCLTEPGAGSDALGIKTRAVPDGDHYIINGQKTFITNAPIADYFLVVTREEGGPRDIRGGTLFVLERDTEGLSVGEPFHKLGMRCALTSEVFFDNVRVSKEKVLGVPGDGFLHMMDALDVERATAPITSIGIARACLEVTLKYSKERVQFGRPICEFQLIRQKLAEMALGIEHARTYTYRVIWMLEQGMKITKEVSMAKLYAARMGVQAALDAVQILGGYGYTREYPVERLLRDAKISEIGGGTNEVQTLIISRELLKEG